MSTHILLVEDDSELQMIIASCLKREKFNVLLASSGKEAFQILQKNPHVKVVLSDIRMPGGDGLELLERVRTEISDPPAVILMTGYCDTVFSEALKAGAHSILPKPFTTELMIAHLNNALNHDAKAASHICFDLPRSL